MVKHESVWVSMEGEGGEEKEGGGEEGEFGRGDIGGSSS